MTLHYRLFFVAFFFFLNAISSVSGSDFDVLRNRFINETKAGKIPSATGTTSLLNSMRSDGSWSDIDYNDFSQAGGWSPLTHLNRILSLAIAYDSPGQIHYQSPTLVERISLSLDFWYTKDPRAINWFVNDLTAPNVIARILLMVQSGLSADLYEKGLARLPEEPRNIGQNRVWFSELVIFRGLIEGSAERVESGVQGIADTIVIVPEVGPQVDGTFFQHGKLIYNGGYGLAYVDDVTQWMERLGGTQFAFGKETEEVLATLILGGTGWMARYGTLDYNVIGRGIARKGQGRLANNLRRPLERMIALHDSHQTEYQALLDHITKNSTQYPYVEGQKHFWQSDYSVNRRAGFLTSLRTFSTRTVGGESNNNENIQGEFLPFGMTLIYRSGNEYDNIMPVWNWRRLPGTTVEQDPIKRPASRTSQRGHSDFVGGVSNGKLGMSAFQQYDLYNPVVAHKIWFFFDQGFVALGTGIECQTDFPVFTTLNQSNFNMREPVIVGEGRTEIDLSDGERTLSSPDWVYHNGVGYVFPNEADVYVKNDNQTGSWGFISGQYEVDRRNPVYVTSPVFLVGIDHGLAHEAKDYAYMVLPIGDKAAVADFSQNNPIQILSNTKEIQAVKHLSDKVVGISFYQPGELEIEPGVILSVDHACLVLVELDKEPGSEFIVSVSNPLNEALSVKLSLTGKLDGPNASYDSLEHKTSIEFVLPDGDYAGSTLTQAYAETWDLDSDGLRDRWEYAFFDHLNFGGSDDGDKDLYTNAEEFVAGTSPMDRLDFPSLKITPRGLGKVNLSFKSKGADYPGYRRLYSLETNSFSENEDWVALPGAEDVEGNNTEMEFEVDGTLNRFYRLQIKME